MLSAACRAFHKISVRKRSAKDVIAETAAKAFVADDLRHGDLHPSSLRFCPSS
jgi:hypothetical protein